MKMEKNIFLLLFCGLIAVLVVGIDTGVASAKTWHVDDDFTDYPAANFSSIQDAIDAADPRDIVFVYNGTYYEDLIINKPLKLTGESMESIICGAWYGNCVKIMSSNVSVDGFTIKYSSPDGAGIYVSSNSNIIANNTIIENGYGIKLIEDNNTIMNNIITNNSDSDGIGIYVSSNNNTIANNTVIENICGIELNGDNNIIMSNLIVNNSNDIYLKGDLNDVINNTICNDIYLKGDLNDVINNTICNDIYLKGDLNDVINNTIWNVDLHYPCGYNNIISNNINKEIIITGSDYNLISNNYVNGNINLDDFSNYNNISNNNINISVNLEYSQYNNIINNSVKAGIDLDTGSSWDGSKNNTIANNTVKYIILKGSDSNKILNNLISQSNGDGININEGLVIISRKQYKSGETTTYSYESSESNEIAGNIINSSNGNGIYLSAQSKNTRIVNNSIHSNKGIGIYVYKSSDVEITGNTIDFNQQDGIFLSESADSRITNNTINSNNGTGFKLQSSSNIIMANNDLSGNRYNFGVSGNELSHYVHSIDTSNNIEGKTICYLVSERDMKVPEDAGYVGLVNSSNITVKDLKVGKNGQGILLAYSSGENQIVNNTIKDNEYGIYLYLGSSFNRIYHNNFINNIRNAEEIRSANYFDNGPIIGGNYWSDHKCKGNPSNGTQPYIIPVHNSQDKYPFENENGWL